MDIFILKFSACLAVFMLFYKLVLERESIHHFKRFFLLASLLISAAIPFITFTTFVEATPTVNTIVFSNFETISKTPEIAPTFSDYLPTILWSVYYLGVLVFAGRFMFNLFQLVKRIKQNPKYKKGNLVHVLMTDLVYPHTFLQYIFLNKTKYETHKIPKEVMLHEETHAKQKHALDILFIELMQVVFWFNPLLYFIKKDIKLNHEFLADQAVLKTGTDTKSYQHILLAFSASNTMEDAQTHHLANAINYSLIKKRFTVMKSHTSNTVKWVKGLIILPVLAVLIYSFSSRKEVLQHAEPEIVNSYQKGASKEQIAEYNKLATITTTQIINQGFVKHKDVERLKHLYSLMTLAQKEKAAAFPDFSKPPPPPVPAQKQQNQPTQKEIDDYNVWAKMIHSKTTIISNNTRLLPIVDEQNLIKFSKVYNRMTLQQKNESIEFPFPGLDVKENEDNLSLVPPPPPPPVPANATPEEKAKYKDVSNEYYKKYKVENGKVSERLPPPPPPPIPANATPEQQEKYKKVQDDYNQKYKVKKGEVSNIPPPPPAPPRTMAVGREINQAYYDSLGTLNEQEKSKTGFLTINDEKHYYVSTQGQTKYYNRWGNQVDKSGKILSTTQTNGTDVVPGQKISKVYQNDQVVSEFNKNWESDSEVLNPPPPPISPLDHVIKMAKKDASFFYEGKSVSSDRAIAVLKSNTELNILTQNADGNNPRVYITKEPINNETISKTEFPKPTAENAISHLKVMNRHGAKFYINAKAVSFNNALKAVRKNKNADINSTMEPPVVKISTKLIGVMGEK